MEDNWLIKIPTRLFKDIDAYCRINGITMEEYVGKLLKKAFMEDKYGTSPNIEGKSIENITEKKEEPKKEGSNQNIRLVVNKEEPRKTKEDEIISFATPKKRVLN